MDGTDYKCRNGKPSMSKSNIENKTNKKNQIKFQMDWKKCTWTETWANELGKKLEAQLVLVNCRFSGAVKINMPEIKNWKLKVILKHFMFDGFFLHFFFVFFRLDFTRYYFGVVSGRRADEHQERKYSIYSNSKYHFDAWWKKITKPNHIELHNLSCESS